MSLINQMLRDLEERRRKETTRSTDITAVSLTKKRRWPWLVAVLVALVVGGGVLSFWPFSETADTPAPHVAAIQTEKKTPAGPAVSTADETPTNGLLSLQASETDQELRIVLELRQAIAWHIVRSDPRTITVAVPMALHATLDTAPLQWLDHWRQAERGGNNELIFTASTDMIWNVFSLAADGQHGWRMVIQGSIVAQPQPKPQPEQQAQPAAGKTSDTIEEPVAAEAVKPTVTGTLKKEVAPRDRLWDEARLARQKGELGEAVRALNELLVVAPEDREGRFELIRVLLDLKNVEQALRVAEQGAQQQAAEPLWLILKARLLAESDQLFEALQALDVDTPPAISQSPEFYALKAALLQRAARYQDALPVYQHLCATFPQQAQWWFGRAVTADQVGNQTEARQSFRQALALPGLDPQLQQYATQQLQRLGDGD